MIKKIDSSINRGSNWSVLLIAANPKETTFDSTKF